MPDLKKMRDERGKLVKDARAIQDKADTEERKLTAEESEQFDKLMERQQELADQIQREVDLKEAERAAAEVEAKATKGEQRDTTKPETPEEQRDKAVMTQFRSYLLTGQVPMEAQELRAMQADVDVSGGYLVPPEQFVRQLIQAKDNLVFIRQHATVIPVTDGESLGVPSLDTDPADAAWTAEIGSVSEDSSMAVGKRSLDPHQLTKLVKVSIKLLRKSAFPAEQLVRDRLAYKFGVSEEKGFLTGNGAGQPLGVFTASAHGISTSRDVSTGNTTTEIRSDGLIEAVYSVKAGYLPNARWIFHRDAVKQIRKLKDGDGQYIWAPGLKEGQPDTILNYPFHMSEYAPNTFTTGLYVGLFGDFSYYWIADSLAMEIQRLVELYAGNSQVGFIGRQEVDGMPVLEEAFARVKLG